MNTNLTLREQFNDLQAMQDKAARGLKFESFLRSLFRAHGVVMQQPFRITGEQIDGSFEYRGFHYLVEAKWRATKTAAQELYGLRGKVDGKPEGTRGLFISIGGYSDEAMPALISGKRPNTFLWDASHIEALLNGPCTVCAMLDATLRHAITKNELLVPTHAALQYAAETTSVEHRTWRDEHYIREKTAFFSGREHAFAFLESALQEKPGYIVVEGVPGIGKTALLAEFAKRTGSVAHFNIQAQGITDASAFLASVHHQLCRRFTISWDFPNDAGRDGQYFNLLLDCCSEQVSPEERIIIVVDALDEARSCAGANPLFLPIALPPNVSLLVSRRSHTSDLETAKPPPVLDLMQYPQENLNDARVFVRTFLESRLPTMPGHMSIVQYLLERSKGNFMFLHYVLLDLESGRMSIDDLSALPQGLTGYYERHLCRMLNSKPAEKAKCEVLYVLAALEEPVPITVLADCVGQSDWDVQQYLAQWAQFLDIRKHPRGPDLYALYHKSYADFLLKKDTVKSVGIDLVQVNNRVMRALVDGIR